MTTRKASLTFRERYERDEEFRVELCREIGRLILGGETETAMVIANDLFQH